MRLLNHKAGVLALTAGIALASAGCDSFLEVTNPNTLEAEAIDPEKDGPLLAQSVYQDFINSWGDIPLYSAWFTNEARVGDTFPTRNSVGRRDVQGGNSHLDDIWEDIHANLQFARSVSKSIAPAGNTIHMARTKFSSAFMILLMAENFCEGTIAESTLVSRGQMSTAQLLDSAVVALTEARSVAQAASAAATDDDVAQDAADLATAALVGIARAQLQAGRPGEASAAASQVPADFEFSLWHLDDANNRSLGNNLWSFSESRISLVVGPEYRAIADAGDPRVSYVDEGRVSQDGILTFYRQDKFQGFGDDERFASGLEARYIQVEADANPGAMLTFINERRAVGNQTALSGITDINVLMAELMEQKSRDFWLEGKRLPDWRRNGDAVPFIIPAGEDTYYKSDLGPVRDFNCWDVPEDEINDNPNW